jgi:hypothetical protein
MSTEGECALFDFKFERPPLTLTDSADHPLTPATLRTALLAHNPWHIQLQALQHQMHTGLEAMSTNTRCTGDHCTLLTPSA